MGSEDSVTLCLVPVSVAAELLPTLAEFFAESDGMRIVVDRRRPRDRRRARDRRQPVSNDIAAERRRIRSARGRRVGERRASVRLEPAPTLPDDVAEHAAQLQFVRRRDSPQRQADLKASWAMVRLQAGEQEAFDALYREFYGRLGAYVRRLTGDAHESEDVVQDVFTAVLRAAADFDPGRGSARSCIFAVAHNRSLNSVRKLGRIQVEDPTSELLESEPAIEQLSSRLAREQVLTILRGLPRAQQQVLWLRYVAELSTDEIAQAMQRTRDNVRQLQRRGLAALGERMAT